MLYLGTYTEISFVILTLQFMTYVPLGLSLINYVSLVNWVRTAVWVWINSYLKLWKESQNNWPQCQMYCEAVEKLRKMGGKVALFQLSGKVWVATYHLFTVGAATTRHNYHADPRNHWFVNPTPRTKTSVKCGHLSHCSSYSLDILRIL